MRDSKTSDCAGARRRAAQASAFACSLLLIAGCSQQAKPPKPRQQASPIAVPVVPRHGPAAGCADAIRVELDTGPEAAWTDDAGKPFPAARLDDFHDRVTAAFRAAADESCKTAAVAKRLKGIHRVLVLSAAGAAEPAFDTGESAGPGDLVFEWAFNEAALAVPDRKDIAMGLRCWADPQRSECADAGD